MLHLVELVCLDRSPDLVSVQSADGFLINPTRGWAEELKRVAVEQPGVCDAPVVLQNMLRRLLLVLRFATGMKTTVHLCLCGGAQAVVEAELAVLGDLIRKVKETSELEIIVFGESVGTEELGGLHSLCRCPEEDEDCLFPYACASCRWVAGRWRVFEAQPSPLFSDPSLFPSPPVQPAAGHPAHLGGGRAERVRRVPCWGRQERHTVTGIALQL